MFKKVLIANRGETALRILRTCREMGIATVAVHSVADEHAMHVRLADESVCIGPAPSSQSYLNIPAILSAAEISGADAIHPGVGFLAENKNFAEVILEHGITFIGPSPEHIHVMGDKVLAKKKAKELGLRTVPGSDGEVKSLEEAIAISQEIGYPVLIKATAGGGGKGMRVVSRSEDLAAALDSARAESEASFGNDGVYIEKYLRAPRHIELQIIGDKTHVVCLGERDCSLQRRHQKIWEEAPCSALSQKERTQIMAQAIAATEALGYQNAGTLEFLYENGEFFFIEMNTRLQVEHPITEMITGVDIVREQIRIAAGLGLSFRQEDIQWRGHAIECRINAENPETFTPSPGTIEDYHAPGGAFVRTDSALFSGAVVPPTYDSLVAKLVVSAPTREECVSRMQRALSEYVITGINTSIPLHMRLCHEPDVLSGNYHVNWLAHFLSQTPFFSGKKEAIS